MRPLLYVEEEFHNVKRALDESLRFDYGPGQTSDYYQECTRRLEGISVELERLRLAEAPVTSRIVSELWDLANRLTLIERSHLGEFSWPFANALRDVASKLLSEPESLREPEDPIIQMIAEGTTYRIVTEQVLPVNARQRMLTVAFPRQLKHHVLMHALFGHELGHATFYSPRDPGQVDDDTPSAKIIQVLRREGPLRDAASVREWLRGETPEGVSPSLKEKPPITETNLGHWHVELVCDLFGLIIFGPAFSAAHRAYLEPSCRSAYEIDVTRKSHPAYALRRTLLVQALRILGWDKPVAEPGSALFQAETELLKFVGKDGFGPWAEVFSDAQVSEALDLIRRYFAETGAEAARRPTGATLDALVARIVGRLPPIHETVDDGMPRQFEVRLEEQLYAGWTYWLGREHVDKKADLTFAKLNQLCDLGLLQQQAIDISAGRRPLQ